MKPLKSGDPDMIGDVLLRGRLGEGGMGTVYFGVTPDKNFISMRVNAAGKIDQVFMAATTDLLK